MFLFVLRSEERNVIRVTVVSAGKVRGFVVVALRALRAL